MKQGKLKILKISMIFLLVIVLIADGFIFLGVGVDKWGHLGSLILGVPLSVMLLKSLSALQTYYA